MSGRGYNVEGPVLDVMGRPRHVKPSLLGSHCQIAEAGISMLPTPPCQVVAKIGNGNGPIEVPNGF